MKKIITRSQKARQNLIHVHISVDQVGFYEWLGWAVEPEGRGSRVSRMAIISGRMPAILVFGFPLVVSKVLRPRGVQHTFRYPLVIGRPVLDASVEAARLVDVSDLDP